MNIMNINLFTQVSKQLLILTSLIGMGAVSVSPALADNQTDSMESSTEMETPMGETNTDVEETPMVEDSTEMEETPMVEDSTEMETPMVEDSTEMETPMGETNTDMEETPMVEDSTEMEETPMVEDSTEMETPMGETNTDMQETPMVEDSTEMETPMGETNTDMEETPMVEDSTEMETPMVEDSTEMETPMGESNAEAGNIVEVASGSESFNTLVQAIQAAGLADTLSDSNASYTVFAPTDEAFSQLPDGTLEYLLQPENQEVLQRVLSYHVLPTEVTSSEISGGSVDSLSGGLATAVTDSGVVINNASVINPDIQASNGVIHGINRVLLPSDLQTTLASELGVNEADLYQ